MAQMKFDPGDVVRLKSGGPRMTIISGPDAADECRCVWFTVEALMLNGSKAIPKYSSSPGSMGFKSGTLELVKED
jgi:uncharacterized protein YodC (DUF2158 family)